MALKARLEVRQSQALVMTPQLQQAIKLLQLSSLDLAAFVEQELERNPLLERDEGPDSDAFGSADPDATAASSESLPLDRALADEGLGLSGATLDAPFEDDGGWAPTGADEAGAGPWSSTRGGSFDEAGLEIDDLAGESPDLRRHLTDQLGLSVADPARRLIGAHLIDLLDETGYLTEPLDMVAERLGCAPEDVEAVLRVLQTLDPPGVFARTLAECLALQLKDRNRFDPAMQALVAHLELVARRDFAALRQICGVDDEDLRDMLAELRRLNPKPGLAFGGEDTTPPMPDILVRSDPAGGWRVELNSETLPRVLVNNRYYARVNGANCSREERAYVSECLAGANWLVKSLEQRARTILKVASEIVRQQDSFLREGVRGLRPLNLRTVAEAVSMHESTISRVTSNKYMATPRGLFELKYFFTSALASSTGGEAHSAEAVRDRIKALVDAESGEAILSDDKIVELLRASGIDIARRTVAKYREALHIPSSVERRRLKSPAL